MNKRILAFLLMGICVMGVSACGNKNNINVSKNNTETKIEEKAEVKTEETPETKVENNTEKKSEIKNEETVEVKSESKENIPNRYYVAGIDDPVEFEKVFNTVKSLVAKGEKEKVAEYIRYPLTSANITVTNKEEFVKNYDTIITEGVKNAFVNQKVEETFVNYKGVMVGNGQIWFGAIIDNNLKTPKYLIIGVNQI